MALHMNRGIGLSKMQANKALQLTPSSDLPISYDRPRLPSTPLPELVRPFGVAELGVRRCYAHPR